MKSDLIASFLAASLLSASLGAAPLARPTPVHVAASEAAAVLTILRAGSELPSLAEVPAPVGWKAVSLPPPHETYVQNTYIAKDLTVKPDAPLYAAPETTATLMTKAVTEDPIEITGLRGRWTQLRLNRPIVGYVQTGMVGTMATAPLGSPSSASNYAVTATPVSDGPGAAPVLGQPAPWVGQTANQSALPRLFEGKVVSTRSPFRPRRPYDYAIVDESGVRLAYLDFSKIMQLSQIEGYTDRQVTAYGPAEAVPDSTDIVLRVESLRLR